MGAALIDTLYCVLGALGAAVLLSAHPTQRLISAIGALVIGWIAIKTIIAHKKSVQSGPDQDAIAKVPIFGSALRLSLVATSANPLTIISWVALLSAAGTFITSTSGKVGFALGVGGGSFLFFLSLSLVATYVGRRLSANWIRRIDQGSAFLILIFALLLVYRAFTI